MASDPEPPDGVDAPNPSEPPEPGRPDSLRRAVERRSAVPLLWLHGAPQWLLPALLAGFLLGGLLLDGVLGALLLLLVAAFLGWLAFLAWPRLATSHRALRCAAVGALVVLAVAQSGIF